MQSSSFPRTITPNSGIGVQYLIRKLAIALTLFVHSGAMTAAPTTSQAGILDRDIPQILTENRITSVSLATIKDGKLDVVVAYGAQSEGVPATVRSLYNIASLTKPLTAEVILRLASRRNLSLDEPMYRVWTDPDIASDERRKLLTLRFALSHRSGFPNWRNPKTGLTFERPPGQEWGYSGEGYQYAARFAERKAGTGFEALAQQLLFDPLHMGATSYVRTAWFEGRIAVPTSATGTALFPLSGDHYNAADLVYSTPQDYATFMIDVLNDHGLTHSLARERDRIQTDMMKVTCAGPRAATCPLKVGMGLGWQILKFKGETLMMHTGKDEGVFTFAYLNKTSREGVVIFTNSDNGYKIILPLLERLHTSSAFLRLLRGQIE
jgi:CubicO group peptidase (beta-lactamase class C family)